MTISARSTAAPPAAVPEACRPRQNRYLISSAAPTTQNTGGEPRTGGSLIDLQNVSIGDPEHIDPALSSTIQGSQPGQLIFDGLTETDYHTGELKPAVAERWESNDDAAQWTFQLRKLSFNRGADHAENAQIIQANLNELGMGWWASRVAASRPSVVRRCGS